MTDTIETETGKALTPLKEGETVFVRNTSMSGKLVIEGRAVIVSRLQADIYRVRFDGGRLCYTRFVLPEHRSKELSDEERAAI